MASQEELDHALAQRLQAEETSQHESSMYDMESDLELARKLQLEEEEEYKNLTADRNFKNENLPGSTTARQGTEKLIDKMKTMSLVDPAWETIDPTPDIHVLFQVFDDTYFYGRLKSCEVKWSPRMTLCAGVCCYQPRIRFCSIRLSKPLLTLRPRKDLVETLLHEMIHAYLFLTENNRDRDGHGPEFHKHMKRINDQAGTRISVYHSFFDEVRHFKSHHWRCDGPCKSKAPFYGWVKRSMNRAPSKNDFWWPKHEQECGGKFIKVSEPEKQTKGKTKDLSQSNTTGSKATTKTDSQKNTAGSQKTTTKTASQKTRTNTGSRKDTNDEGRQGSILNGGIQKRPRDDSTEPDNSPLGKHFKKTKSKTQQDPSTSGAGPSWRGLPSGHIAPTGNFGRDANSGSQSTPNISGFGARTGSGSRSTVITIKGPVGSRPSERPANISSFVAFQGTGHVLGSSQSGSTASTSIGKGLRQPSVREAFQKRDKSASDKQKEKARRIINLFSSDDEDENGKLEVKTTEGKIQTPLSANGHDPSVEKETTVICPVCSQKVIEANINEHLDSCAT